MAEKLDPFESPKLLLSGAARHIETLKARIAEHRAEPNAIVVETVEEPAGLPMTRPGLPIPPDLKQIAFDIVHNLRSALDQAVYSGTVELIPGDPHSTKFPFGDDAVEVERNAKSQAKDVPPELLAFVLKLEPHRNGNRPLWGLNKLRNRKSHRILVPVTSSLKAGLAGESRPSAVTAGPTLDQSTGVIEFSLDEPGPNEIAVAGMFVVSLEIQIGTGTFLGEPAVGVFDHLLGEVERIVLGIEAETARLLRARGG